MAQPWQAPDIKFEGIISSEGDSTFGKLFQAVNLKSGIHYAIRKSSIGNLKSQISEGTAKLYNPAGNLCKMLREVCSLCKLDNPFVLKYHGAWFEGPLAKEYTQRTRENNTFMSENDDFEESDDTNNSHSWTFLFLQMDLCHYNLGAWLFENETIDKRNVIEIHRIFIQILKGLKYIHGKAIVHRNLKPRNIFLFIRENEQFSVKIGDFGLGIKIEEENKFFVFINYHSPEILQCQLPVDSKSDIFSLGLIFLEMMYPFKEDEEIREEIFPQIQKGTVTFPNGFLTEFPNEAEVIKGMTLMDPQKRPKAVSILKLLNGDMDLPVQSKSLEYTNFIGQGSYGRVYLAKGGFDQGVYAVKQVSIGGFKENTHPVPKTGEDVCKVRQEVLVLVKLDNPHVVRYFDCWIEGPLSESFTKLFKDSGYFDENLKDYSDTSGNLIVSDAQKNTFLYIKMGYCQMTLKHLMKNIKNKNVTVDPVIMNGIRCQILTGLHYIHQNNVVHRDLKPDNIFIDVSKDQNYWVKIGDFGLAENITDNLKSYGMNPAGCPQYRSPEMIDGKFPYTLKTDIFSLGLIFLEMNHTFSNKIEKFGVFYDIQYGIYHSLNKLLTVFIKDCKYVELLQEMLQKNPDNRPTADKILEIILSFEYHDTGTSTGIEDSSSTISVNFNDVDKPLTVLRMWFEVPEVKNSFYGRDMELTRLFRLNEEQRKLFVVILGESGIGKTELVRKFGEDFYTKVKGSCVWIKGGRFRDSVTKLASEFSISCFNNDGSPKMVSEIFTEMKPFLSKIAPWLLIIDDVDDKIQNQVMDLVKILATYPEKCIPFIVATTVTQNFANNSNEYCIQLTAFEKREAIDFVLKVFPQEREEDIKVLCKRLKYHPLALQLSLAFIKMERQYTRRFTIFKYIKRLNKQNCGATDAELLDEFSEVICEVWNVTFFGLKKANKVGKIAFDLLSIMAYVNGNSHYIRMEFLAKVINALELVKQESRKEINFFVHGTDYSTTRHQLTSKASLKNNNPNIINEELLTQAIQLLLNYQLCSQSESQIILHPLLQKVIKQRHGETNSKQQKLSMEKLGQALFVKLRKEITKEDIIHVQTYWENVSLLFEEIGYKFEHYSLWISDALINFCMYEDALEYSKFNLAFLTRILDDNHEDVLSMENYVAISLEKNGFIKESFKLMKIAYEKHQKILGDEHKLTIAIGINIISKIADQGCLQALEFIKVLLKSVVKVCGVDHEWTACVKHAKASVLREQGEFLEAINIYEEVLKLFNKIENTEERILKTKYNIGICLWHLEKYEDAVDMFENLLKEQILILGAEHPNTQSTNNWLIKTKEKKLNEADKA